uniref:MIF4G domain-containing protein n=1 Tax=Steinernema glaseri TaxID=37863 RepID=A0A1I7Z8M3_9BILA
MCVSGVSPNICNSGGAADDRSATALLKLVDAVTALVEAVTVLVHEVNARSVSERSNGGQISEGYGTDRRTNVQQNVEETREREKASSKIEEDALEPLSQETNVKEDILSMDQEDIVSPKGTLEHVAVAEMHEQEKGSSKIEADGPKDPAHQEDQLQEETLEPQSEDIDVKEEDKSEHDAETRDLEAAPKDFEECRKTPLQVLATKQDLHVNNGASKQPVSSIEIRIEKMVRERKEQQRRLKQGRMSVKAEERQRRNDVLRNAMKPLKRCPSDIDLKTHLCREIRSLLNKITPSTFDTLSNKFLQMKIYKYAKVLPTLIDVIFYKALDEPMFSPVYSDLCRRQVDEEMRQTRSHSFRDILLVRCQKTFNFSEIEHKEKMKKMREEMKAHKDPKQRAVIQELIDISEKKFKDRTLGLIHFFAELYRNNLISSSIITWCIVYLLRRDQDIVGMLYICLLQCLLQNGGDDLSIECVVKMLTNVGKTSYQRSRLYSLQNNVDQEIFVGTYISHLNAISAYRCNRIRFMIENLVDLQFHNWKHRPRCVDRIQR